MFKIPKWNVEELCGYTPKTTFWQDFSIADVFGPDAVQDTFNRAFKEWKDDVVYLTEMVMVLNHKCNYFYSVNIMPLYKLYLKLYEQANEYAMNHLKGKNLQYFYQVTDLHTQNTHRRCFRLHIRTLITSVVKLLPEMIRSEYGALF